MEIPESTAGGARTVAESSEHEIIALFARAAEEHAPDASGGGLVVENGDDAAVFAASADVVASTDMIVEGTHFRREWSTPAEIGARAVAQAASDIAAMGARTRFLVLALCLTPELPLDDVAGLAEGAAREASRAGARIIGGDVTTGPALVLAPMALGDAGRRTVTLSGARPGDVLALSGTPGRAAAGLALVSAGYRDGPAQDAFRVPRPPYTLGPAAADAGATALTDVTDGLLRDLSGLCAASGVVATVDTSRLAADPVLDAAAELLGDAVPEDVREWRLTGGEDHGLLASFPPGTELPGGFAEIGVIRDADGTRDAGTVLVDGEPARIAGWDSARGGRAWVERPRT